MKKLMKLLFCVAILTTAPAFSFPLEEGANAYEDGDYETALLKLRPLAEQGDEYAQFYLGKMYQNGWGVPQDYKKAIKWFSESAYRGDATAQFYLGVMYSNGEGVPQDYHQGARFFRMSAERGDQDSQHNLGVMYAEGLGVPKDYVLGYMWLNIGASNGAENGDLARDTLAEIMSREQIEKAQDLTRECIAKGYEGC